ARADDPPAVLAAAERRQRAVGLLGREERLSRLVLVSRRACGLAELVERLDADRALAEAAGEQRVRIAGAALLAQRFGQGQVGDALAEAGVEVDGPAQLRLRLGQASGAQQGGTEQVVGLRARAHARLRRLQVGDRLAPAPAVRELAAGLELSLGV